MQFVGHRMSIYEMPCATFLLHEGQFLSQKGMFMIIERLRMKKNHCLFFMRIYPFFIGDALCKQKDELTIC